MSAQITIHTFAERPDLADASQELTNRAWPAFMLNDVVADRYWDPMLDAFPQYQFVALDAATGQMLGSGNSVPLRWTGNDADLPDEGWDWAIREAVEGRRAERTPTVQCAISIQVAPEARGRGLSRQLVMAMRSIGRDHGLRAMYAPVRPSGKSRYPLIPMAQYVQWTTEEGLPFDPWLRVHARLGAQIVKVCPRSMLIEGAVGDWTAWTEMPFPGSGQHIIPYALNPVTINLEADSGRYVEPNVWMKHSIAHRTLL